MNEMRVGIATVIPLTGLKKALAYRVPESLRKVVAVGSLVRIPLLRRSELGVVRGFGVSERYPIAKLKYLFEALHPFPVLTEDLLRLGEWMRDYYAASLDAVFEAMIPAAVRKGMGLKRRRFLTIGKELGPDALQQLRRKAPRQADLYAFLRGQIKPLLKNQVLNRLKIAPSSCRALVEKGFLLETRGTLERVAYNDPLGLAEEVSGTDFVLTAEQRAARLEMIESLEREAFRVHLLHGVTGSGKTEVYIQILKRALEMGGAGIYLVPEVALTPQTVGRLRARLEKASGAGTVVWHSHLSEGERFDAWRSLATGEARLVVGARSAIFAPLPNLKVVIVDEEHEPAYKQDETPRYHGRDVAVYRAKLCRALCILGSATPSLESIYNGETGKYRVNYLRKRVDDRKLPIIDLVDMKRERISRKGFVTLSRLLAEKMRERYEKKEQTILFINRRGYSTSLLCPECGFVATCEHCSVTMTYHRSDGRLRCHLCGFERPAPSRCPTCRSLKIIRRGLGTQRVEEAARAVLPRARIVRIDSDILKRKNTFRKILAHFRVGKIDVLVGTQMIAKGLDFPNVTLVGLIDADLSLLIPDFRAAERCFQLIVQVAGRSGRGDRAGEVVVQSYLPQSGPIQYARRSDFEGFLEEELRQRREYHYPPFRHLIHHLFRGKNPDKVAFFAEHWARHVEKNISKGLEIRGPAPSPREKVKNNYRFQIWYFVNNVSKMVPRLLALREKFKMDKDVIDVFDVDPVQLI